MTPTKQRNKNGDEHRDAFVVGRAVFARIAAVEGITASAALREDLEALDGASPEWRRAILASKYDSQS